MQKRIRTNCIGRVRQNKSKLQLNTPFFMYLGEFRADPWQKGGNTEEEFHLVTIRKFDFACKPIHEHVLGTELPSALFFYRNEIAVHIRRARRLKLAFWWRHACPSASPGGFVELTKTMRTVMNRPCIRNDATGTRFLSGTCVHGTLAGTTRGYL